MLAWEKEDALKDFTFHNPVEVLFALCMLLVAIAALFALVGCSSPGSSLQSSQGTGATEGTAIMQEDVTDAVFPTELYHPAPEDSAPCETPGELVRLDYSTYEAFSYAAKSQPLEKYAWVYLPYGYTSNERYNIAYLMHGGWSNQGTFLGTPGHPTILRNQIDHAIAAGRIEPTIIVCPTYNNTSPDDAADYSLAIELTARWPQELVNDLMPTVESTYSTFVETSTPEGLMAARDHRAFLGFSMGSVATWRVFEHCLPYFRYFCPSSGNAGSGSRFDAVVQEQGFGPDDFTIMAMTGTRDFAGSGFTAQIEDMGRYPSFRDESQESPNLVFRLNGGGSHDGTAASLYVLNDLLYIWPGDKG